MLILIPAYEPDLRLPRLVDAVRAALPDADLLVVDDGSGPAFDGVFEVTQDAGAHLLRFAANRGKGAALKAGLAWASEHGADVVVCADSDGQHQVRDIVRVAAEVAAQRVALGERVMVLGGRRFDAANVPARSRFGNAVSRWAFRAITGTPIHDTQTGLRGYPAALIPWLLGVDGERFEYESNLLFGARAAGVAVREIPIETIYLEQNASSHFRPIADSARIYAQVLGFVAASLASAVVDWAGVLLLSAAGAPLLAAVVAARVASATVNYRLNRSVVFGAERSSRSAARYAALAAAILAANYALLAAATALGISLVSAKAVTETVLFCAGLVVQKRYVFAPARPSAIATPAAAPVADPRADTENASAPTAATLAP